MNKVHHNYIVIFVNQDLAPPRPPPPLPGQGRVLVNLGYKELFKACICFSGSFEILNLDTLNT